LSRLDQGMADRDRKKSLETLSRWASVTGSNKVVGTNPGVEVHAGPWGLRRTALQNTALGGAYRPQG